MDQHVDIEIDVKGITDRNTRVFRASVLGVPNLVDSLSGSEYMITHMTVTWTWYSDGYTVRNIALTVHKILKSGKISEHPTSRNVNVPEDLPEWLAKIAENHAPAGYRQAVQEKRKPVTPEELARLFHETYERLAPDHGYKTREASAVPWSDVPANNKALMIDVAGHVLTIVVGLVYDDGRRAHGPNGDHGAR